MTTDKKLIIPLENPVSGMPGGRAVPRGKELFSTLMFVLILGVTLLSSVIPIQHHDWNIGDLMTAVSMFALPIGLGIYFLTRARSTKQAIRRMYEDGESPQIILDRNTISLPIQVFPLISPATSYLVNLQQKNLVLSWDNIKEWKWFSQSRGGRDYKQYYLKLNTPFIKAYRFLVIKKEALAGREQEVIDFARDHDVTINLPRHDLQEIAGKAYRIIAGFIAIVLLLFVGAFILVANHSSKNAALADISTNPNWKANTDNLQNTNHLTLSGFGTKPVQVRLSEPQELNGLTQRAILEKRLVQLRAHAYTFPAGYKPLPAIFQNIQDGKPWWGLYGMLVHGSGNESILGTSMRSSSILNPLALVGAQVGDQAIAKLHLWNTSIQQTDTNFPVWPSVGALLIQPASHEMQIHIDVTHYMAAQLPYVKSMLRSWVAEPTVDFEAVNARDMGYPFIHFDSEQSLNITKDFAGPNLMETVEFYHVGGSCGYPGGCNNLSPKQEGLGGYTIKKLPAVAVFKLWHAKPAQAGNPADITYRIYFE